MLLQMARAARLISHRYPLQTRRSLATTAGSRAARGPEPQVPSLLPGLGFLARFGATAYCIQVYVCGTILPAGPSMQPTLNPRGDILFADYISPRFNRINRGDIVLAIKPTDPSVMIVKRVIALAGDPVPNATSKSHPPTVPPGHVWLEGDNAAQSDDSRRYGPVPLALVRGRAWFRFWPLGQITWLN